jgi:hypothetical protein
LKIPLLSSFTTKAENSGSLKKRLGEGRIELRAKHIFLVGIS